MQCTILGVGAYSNVYQVGNRAYKPFDLVAPSIKTDQMIQFDASKRCLRNANSPLGRNVKVETIRLDGDRVEAISMPYKPGTLSLDKRDDWLKPSRAQLMGLTTWLGDTIRELRRCGLIMLDFKLSNIIVDPDTGALDLCDWDSLATEDDATAIFNELSPIPRGTYDPFCCEHPVTFAVETLRYAMAFSAAVTVCVAYYGRHPHLSRPLNAIDFCKRHRAVVTLLSTALGECPAWFSMPPHLVELLEERNFFDDDQ